MAGVCTVCVFRTSVFVHEFIKRKEMLVFLTLEFFFKNLLISYFFIIIFVFIFCWLNLFFLDGENIKN